MNISILLSFTGDSDFSVRELFVWLFFYVDTSDNSGELVHNAFNTKAISALFYTPK